LNARAQAATALQARLGHVFADQKLLERALTHSSVGDGANKGGDNERLEFLGDRVLGLLAAEYVTKGFPEAREGQLSPMLHALVERGACARVARRIGLPDALRLAAGETRQGGRDNDTILGDAMEAVIAALYLEAGLERTREVWLNAWADELASPADLKRQNPKSALQEWAQGQGRPLPIYRVVETSGPAHAPSFTVEAVVEGCDPVRADGPSRQAAEKAAAMKLLARETGA
jgi:ribonuclease-3